MAECMDLIIEPHTEDHDDSWDMFCEKAYMATFLHTRRFLSYHGDRFTDLSLQVTMGKQILGIFPAALDPVDQGCVVSHPGITYGGLLHAGKLRGESMVEALHAVCCFYRDSGYDRLVYKTVPLVYHQAPSGDDLYGLFRLGARRFRCDLSCAIDLSNRLPPSGRRKRSLNKARRSGVEVRTADRTEISGLWHVLEENLGRKHDVHPVHSLDEIIGLANRFPGSIEFVIALLDGNIEAGVVLFRTPTAFHAQYIAASKLANANSLLDAVFDDCINRAVETGVRYFDFGVSNEDQGRVLNRGLYGFKSEFGGGGIVHEFYEITLN